MQKSVKSVTGSQKSLFYKALACGLRPFLTGDNNLSKSHKAMFVAVPFTDGIPEGEMVGQDVTNEKLFRIADVVQGLDSPVFGYDRAGSYFEKQNQYLLNLVDASEPRATKAQAEVQRCLAATKAAYASDVAQFKALTPTNPSLNFADWMNRYAFEYNVAFDDLKYAQAALAKTRSEPMSDVQSRLDSMVAARSPTTYVVGSNMPATLTDHSVRRGNGATSELKPSSGSADVSSTSSSAILYRPLHYLSNYEDTVSGWIEGFQNGGDSATTVRVDLSNAAEESWESLGFKQLDTAPQGLSDILTHSGGAVDFNSILSQPKTQTAADGDIPGNTHGLSVHSPHGIVHPFHLLAKDAQLTCKASGLQTFEVFRGLWNIDNIRSLLPGLSPTAPPSVTNPFLKTSRLLLGYGVEITLSVPTASLKQLDFNKNGKDDDDNESIVSAFLDELDTPAIEVSSLMYKSGLEATSRSSPKPSKATKSRKKNISPETTQTPTAGRTTIWRMTSQDNGSPVLLAALATAV